ncbi:iron-siderophore ABC transporter substrate-binding protein [Vibrio sp. T187]|uniref:ABC transporter substrate-binding protein n=1 Tax=Vibrio TaxID=662 RepID=UPI0010C9799D|nr:MULTISPECIES: ABC transporter substrate-binding protein [Vibrio]MBW3694975.1 iron-siderophore ABC transporter substrate-binding protein [Vibrio sp. T187]
MFDSILKKVLYAGTLLCALPINADTQLNENQPLEQPMPRVMSIDWTQTETLLALGIEPVAVAQIADYNAWVKSPLIPDSVPDVGLRTQPNLERIFELKPEKIFISPMFSSLEPQLSKIAPVTSIGLYRDGDIDWQALVKNARAIAKEVGREEQADVLIQDAQSEIAELKKVLPSDVPPLLMVQFMDSNHVRVFGKNSLYKTSINQLGIESAWPGITNAWGYSLVGIDKLIGIEGQIVIIEPLPAGTSEQLANNQFWQYVVTESGYEAVRVPPVWSFGSIPSATRFARFITEALGSEAQL